MSDWEDRIPTRAEFEAMVREAAQSLAPQDAERVIKACSEISMVAWGHDRYAGACCPLVAAGFERVNLDGRRWDVSGGYEFARRFDLAMRRRIGLAGGGAVGIARGDGR